MPLLRGDTLQQQHPNEPLSLSLSLSRLTNRRQSKSVRCMFGVSESVRLLLLPQCFLLANFSRRLSSSSSCPSSDAQTQTDGSEKILRVPVFAEFSAAAEFARKILQRQQQKTKIRRRLFVSLFYTRSKLFCSQQHSTQPTGNW